MQELRTDELTGAQVIVAPGRATRPEVFRPAADRDATATAARFVPVLCRSRIDDTARGRAPGGGAPDTPGWQVRVVPNLYPIVGDGVAGAHEVIVLSPAHDGQLDRLSPDGGDRDAHRRCATAPRITSRPGSCTRSRS